MQLSVENDCLKVSIDGHSDKKLVPKLVLKASVQELKNIMVSPPEEGGLKEARDEQKNIRMSDSTLHNIFPDQLKMMSV